MASANDKRIQMHLHQSAVSAIDHGRGTCKFTLRKNVKIPNNNLTAHLPPANLRESADKLLDKLEKGGLIKKAPRVCQYKSKAFFKPKRNNEARLLVDYKASQVNNLIQRPTHPQFAVEQLTQQVKPGMQYFLSADITGAYFCKEGILPVF